MNPHKKERLMRYANRVNLSFWAAIGSLFSGSFAVMGLAVVAWLYFAFDLGNQDLT